jgi:DNA-binding NtrC family response regulator
MILRSIPDCRGLDDDATTFIQEFPWPGNYRQLSHTIKRAAANAGSQRQVSANDLKGIIEGHLAPTHRPDHVASTRPGIAQACVGSATPAPTTWEDISPEQLFQGEVKWSKLPKNPSGNVYLRKAVLVICLRALAEHQGVPYNQVATRLGTTDKNVVNALNALKHKLDACEVQADHLKSVLEHVPHQLDKRSFYLKALDQFVAKCQTTARP